MMKPSRVGINNQNSDLGDSIHLSLSVHISQNIVSTLVQYTYSGLQDKCDQAFVVDVKDAGTKPKNPGEERHAKLLNSEPSVATWSTSLSRQEPALV